MTSACPLSFPGVNQHQLILYTIIPPVISFLIISSNSVLIYALYKTGQYATISNKLMIVLSASDLVNGIFMLPYCAFLGYDIESCALKMIIEFIFMLGVYFSFNIYCCITVDRYLLITKASRYPRLMSNCRGTLIILAAFFVALLNIIVLALLPSFITVLLSCLISISSIIAMMAMNWSMTSSLKSHRAKMAKQFPLSSNQGALADVETPASAYTQRQQSVRHHFEAVKTIKHLLISLSILYAPIDVLIILMTYTLRVSGNLPSIEILYAFYFAVVLFISNSWINAVIIARGNRRCKLYISSHIIPGTCRIQAHQATNHPSTVHQKERQDELKIAQSTTKKARFVSHILVTSMQTTDI